MHAFSSRCGFGIIVSSQLCYSSCDSAAHRQLNRPEAAVTDGSLRWPAVIKLVQDVFLEAAGPSAEHSVQDYLRSQRVTSLADLQYLQLDWLCSALQPMGIPPLLLNKFLAQAGQRIAHNAPANPPMPL